MRGEPTPGAPGVYQFTINNTIPVARNKWASREYHTEPLSDLLGEKLFNFMADNKFQKYHQSTDNILLTRNHKDLSSFRNLNVIITHHDANTEDKYESARGECVLYFGQLHKDDATGVDIWVEQMMDVYM
ncbi:Hypothetical protein CINCED_3A025502 [Cinara cedri]|uniref:Uncharacterized protein n=1 Tax=Cinara cedri TaxID=506608 RepID=A0A5E4N3E3_9HEMI|nr:Hypothetical protein CINCED_3A025502 [Cinara cedri]